METFTDDIIPIQSYTLTGYQDGLYFTVDVPEWVYIQMINTP